MTRGSFPIRWIVCLACVVGAALLIARPLLTSASRSFDVERAYHPEPPFPSDWDRFGAWTNQVAQQLVQRVRSNPDSSEAWGALAMFYDVHGELTLAEGCYRDAMACSVARGRVDPRLAYLHALVLDELGRREEASAQLQQLVDLEVPYTPAHWRLAIWRTDAGEHPEAESLLSTASIVADGAVQRRMVGQAMATALVAQHRWMEARLILERLLVVDPANGHLAFLLAQCLRGEGRLDEAVALLEPLGDTEAKWHDPWEAMRWRSWTGFTADNFTLMKLLRERKVIEARSLLGKMTARYPGEDLLIQEARVLRAEEKPTEALAVAEKALATAGTFTEEAEALLEQARAMLAIWLIRRADPASDLPGRILSLVERMNGLGPPWFAPHQVAGQVHEALGDKAAAAAEYLRAHTIDEGAYQLGDRAATLLLEAADRPASITVLESLVQRTPYHAGRRLALARSMLDLGRTEEARPHLQRLAELAPGHPELDELHRRLEAIEARTGPSP